MFTLKEQREQDYMMVFAGLGKSLVWRYCSVLIESTLDVIDKTFIQTPCKHFLQDPADIQTTFHLAHRVNFHKVETYEWTEEEEKLFCQPIHSTNSMFRSYFELEMF